MQYFPLFFDLNHKPVVVVGGGDVACRKIEPLLKAGAVITVVSPQVHPDIESLSQQGKLNWLRQEYEASVLDGAMQIWATTNNSDVNHLVYEDAHKRNIMVNVVDDKPYCDFITPSMIERGPIQLAISSGGASPVLIRNVRRNLEAVLPQNLSLLAQFAKSKRDWVKQRFDSVDKRRQFWERFFDMKSVAEAQTTEQLQLAIEACANESQQDVGDLTVIEWGDDIELLSLKATRLMQLADVVYFTQALPVEYVDMSRRDADKVCLSDADSIKKVMINESHKQGRAVVFVPREERELWSNVATELSATYVNYAIS